LKYKYDNMHNIKKILVVGCSGTSGYNYDENPNDPRIWVHRLAKTYFPDSVVVNKAVTGKDNYWIFLETATELCKEKYDLVIVQWTNLSRVSLPLGLETWKTDSLLLGNIDINLHNSIKISKKWQKDLGDSLRSIVNSHWKILDIIKYVNILIEIQKLRSQKIFFVNVGFKWPTNFFNEIEHLTVSSDLPEFTQKILDVENRDDEESFNLYRQIFKSYADYGSIHEDHWLNLYDPLDTIKIDTMSDTDMHPGDKSQEHFSNFLGLALLDKLKKV
jgi:hypothetical protein